MSPQQANEIIALLSEIKGLLTVLTIIIPGILTVIFFAEQAGA